MPFTEQLLFVSVTLMLVAVSILFIAVTTLFVAVTYMFVSVSIMSVVVSVMFVAVSLLFVEVTIMFVAVSLLFVAVTNVFVAVTYEGIEMMFLVIFYYFAFKKEGFMIVYEPYDFGERVKMVMHTRLLTPTGLAKLLGVSHGSVFKMLKMKDVNMEKVRQVSMVLDHDFIAEIGETSGTMKAMRALEVERAFESREASLREELKMLQERLTERERAVEVLELEVKYLKELLVAYKR